MAAQFTVVGHVGRVTKKTYKGDKKVTFISVASVSFYNKQPRTTWINNVAFYGTLADVVENIVGTGTKIFVSGTISTSRKGKEENVFFIGEKFEVLSFSEDRKNERLQQQAVDNLPEAEDMYTSGPDDDLDVPY